MADWKELTRMANGEPLVVERVRLKTSGVAIEGAFELSPLALLLLVALAVTALVAPRWRCGALLAGTYAALCEARGTRVDVEGGDGSRVFVALH